MNKLLISIIVVLYSNNISAQKYTETYINDANKVGIIWWNQVNTGYFDQSYSKLSNELRNRFTKENWKNQMSILMDEFGNIEDRSVKDTYFHSELEGFEDGFYVTVEYDVKYSKTRDHTENLLLKQNNQFEWQVFDFNYSFKNLEIEK